MNTLQQAANTLLALALAVLVGAAAWWLVTNKPAGPKAEKPPLPAKVDRLAKEDGLAGITLTEEGAQRLGLKVGPVARKPARRLRLYGGEVAVPAGKAILVSAPLGGTLSAPEGGVPVAGSHLKAGRAVFRLLPILTPDAMATVAAALADADGQASNARTQAKLAGVALERARRVLDEGAGSQRQVDEAKAAHDVAGRTLEAAQARRAALAKAIGEGEKGKPAPVPIDAPADGLLRAISALPGQAVPVGAALFEVVDLSAVWVRVPLPVGDLEEVDLKAPALVAPLAAPAKAKAAVARPVPAPPTATPAAGTVDAYYEMANPSGALVPGQRLGASLPLRGEEESLSVPWTAVVIDVDGGTWVYEQSGPLKFVRRRVAVRHTLGEDALLASGPAAGTAVVLAGAQELFGAETGFVK